MLLSACSILPGNNPDPRKIITEGKTAEEIVAELTLEQKAAQMIQPAGYNPTISADMRCDGYGSVLHMYDKESPDEWKRFILDLQEQALRSPAGIPYIYGTDSVHGNIRGDETVIFPHNIGVGAANDPELTYQMGLAVADEMKMTGMLWNFAPCVATAQDLRWGRTYESYSSDPEIVKSLGVAYAKGNIDGGVLPCAKHFLGDGNTTFGSASIADNGWWEDSFLDRGDAELSGEQLDEILAVYKALVDSGVKTIMPSFSSINGVRMHYNKELITGVLKEKWGFDGFVISDWEATHFIPGNDLKEQTINAVNTGIDMLMEPDRYKDCMNYIIEGVSEGLIPRERVDDAVTRIIRVKIDMGIIADPMMENLEIRADAAGCDEYRNLARQLVEKSLVLLKNENKILPLKKGSKIYVAGPAANDTGALCGGWTYAWLGNLDSAAGGKYVSHGKTILDGFNMLADEYGYTIITDPAKAKEVDVVVLCVGEIPYAEYTGDTKDPSLTGPLALSGNRKAIEAVKKLGKPTVACIVAGRNVFYDAFEKDWKAVVMCYLPGSEGDGVANVLAGKAPFSGKLPMPYYSSAEDIGTSNVKFEVGYGLNIV